MNDLKEIEYIFENPHIKEIKKSKILKWQQSENYDVLGAVTELIMDKKFYSKVVPQLTFNDYYPFVFKYYIECMKNDFEGEWVHSKYIAAYELKDFILNIWEDNKQFSKNNISKIKKDLKKNLEQICINANYAFKVVLINGLLEHLFENKIIRKYFSDWKVNNKLNIFYECAVNKNKIIE